MSADFKDRSAAFHKNMTLSSYKCSGDKNKHKNAESQHRGIEMKRKPAICTFLFMMLMMILAAFGSGCISNSGNKSVAVPETSAPDEDELRDTGEADFNALMRDANSNYVKALVSTSKQDFNASEEALDALINDLTNVETRYVETPPAPYAIDETWPEILAGALNISESSREFLRKNDIEASHLALEPMRDLFLELHQRNGVNLMGDRLTVFHTTMEHAVDAAAENDTQSVEMLIPELEFLWTRVKAAEPPDSADGAYESALAEVEEKIHELETAASLGEPEKTKIAAEELRQAFSKVFVKYGVVIA